MTAEPTDFAVALERVQAEYLDMPGLHLTKTQIQRLCGLDVYTCDRVVDLLESAGVLKRTAGGKFALSRLDRAPLFPERR